MKLEYKSFLGSYEMDVEGDVFVGHIIGLEDGEGANFEGKTASELVQAFRDSVDDYLEMCAAKKRQAKKLPSGNISLRISPALHKQLLDYSTLRECSLNNLIETALKCQLSQELKHH